MTKAVHSGSNLASNIAQPKISLLMWHVVNEKRGVLSNIIRYRDIALPKIKLMYKVINTTTYDTISMLPPTMKVVT